MKQDLHMHTTWSDGSGTPREMVERALELGFGRIGISDHSYLAPDEGYCLPQDTQGYITELRALAAEYAGRIEVLAGIEQDFFSPALPRKDAAEPDAGADGAGGDRPEFDYRIGSVHYVAFGDEIVSIDDTPEIFERAAREFCGGDYLLLAQRYFETVADVVARTGADIVGHFDLVKKFNGQGRYFDEESPRYRAAWRAAADALLQTGAVFEVNTGGMFRAWRSDPYPGREICDYLAARGARLIAASDAHCPQAIGYGHVNGGLPSFEVEDGRTRFNESA